MWGLAASLLCKGPKCKPLRTGCPQQVPEAHGPSQRRSNNTHAHIHVAERRLEATGQSRSGQGRQGHGSQARGNTGLGLRGSSRTRSPLCAGERLASRSRSKTRLCGAHNSFHPGSNQPIWLHSAGCNCSPTGLGFHF